jgi:hypothetical protein
MKILLGKFDAKLGIQNIFRLTGYKRQHGDNGDNGVGVVQFCHIWLLMALCSCTETFINTLGHRQGKTTAFQ